MRLNKTLKNQILAEIKEVCKDSFELYKLGSTNSYFQFFESHGFYNLSIWGQMKSGMTQESTIYVGPDLWTLKRVLTGIQIAILY